jgi:hypothetical protein
VSCNRLLTMARPACRGVIAHAQPARWRRPSLPYSWGPSAPVRDRETSLPLVRPRAKRRDSCVQLVCAGDEVLFASDVTQHTKRICSRLLSGLGVTATSFPAEDASCTQLARLFADRSADGSAPSCKIKAVLVSGLAPPALRLADLAEISRLAHAHKAFVIYDNTWGCGWAYDAIAMGADVVVCSAAGALSPDGGPAGLGLVTATDRLWKEVLIFCGKRCCFFVEIGAAFSDLAFPVCAAFSG